MKNKKHLILLPLAAALLALPACDDGPVGRAESGPSYSGFTAKLTGTVSGTGSWPEYYQVVLAGFDDTEYATAQATVSPDAAGRVSRTLPNLGPTVQTVELCVTNPLRRRIVSFRSVPVSELRGDTLYLDAGAVDAGMYATLQREVFDKRCAHCHGGAGTAAGGLDLTEGRSYAALVGQPSLSVPDSTRVLHGNAAASILHQILLPEEVLGLPVTHGDLLGSTERRLIDEWIDAGARE